MTNLLTHKLSLSRPTRTQTQSPNSQAPESPANPSKSREITAIALRAFTPARDHGLVFPRQKRDDTRSLARAFCRKNRWKAGVRRGNDTSRGHRRSSETPTRPSQQKRSANTPPLLEKPQRRRSDTCGRDARELPLRSVKAAAAGAAPAGLALSELFGSFRDERLCEWKCVSINLPLYSRICLSIYARMFASICAYKQYI